MSLTGSRHPSQPHPSQERSALDYVGEMIGNVPGSAVDVASDLWSAISSPLDTAGAIGSAALGGGQLAKDALGIPSPGLFGEHRDSARAVGDYYGERYGGGDEFLDTLRTDPVGDSTGCWRRSDRRRGGGCKASRDRRAAGPGDCAGRSRSPLVDALWSLVDALPRRPTGAAAPPVDEGIYRRRAGTGSTTQPGFRPVYGG